MLLGRFVRVTEGILSLQPRADFEDSFQISSKCARWRCMSMKTEIKLSKRRTSAILIRAISSVKKK